jgi:hypothetical protein
MAPQVKCQVSVHKGIGDEVGDLVGMSSVTDSEVKQDGIVIVGFFSY